MSFVWTLSSFKFKFNMIFKVNCSAVFNLETLLAAPGELVFRQQSLLSMVKLAFVRRGRSSCFKITLSSHYLTISGGAPPALQDLPESLVSLYSHYGKVILSVAQSNLESCSEYNNNKVTTR